MPWVAIAIIVFGVAGLIFRGCRLRERSRCVAHARQLRSLLQRARSGDMGPLRAHANACHERGPGPEAAEAWFSLGCALLDRQRPEDATRTFQLACHAHAGLASATLLAFTGLKVRAEEMPDLARRVVETHAELGRPAIPGSGWERQFLRALHVPDLSRPHLSDLARSVLSIPVATLHAQVAEAIARKEAWAAPLTTMGSDAGRRR